MDHEKQQEYERQKKLVLKSFNLQEHPSRPLIDVFDVATEAIRDGCMGGKNLVQAVLEVRDVLVRAFGDHGMTRHRAAMIAQALLMKAVYAGAGVARLYWATTKSGEKKKGEEEEVVVAIKTYAGCVGLDLAHDPGWPQERRASYVDRINFGNLVGSLPEAVYTFAGGRAPFDEVTRYLNHLLYGLALEQQQQQQQQQRRERRQQQGQQQQPPDEEDESENAEDSPRFQDFFVTSLHAMFYGVVHKKIKVEKENVAPQGEPARLATVVSAPEAAEFIDAQTSEFRAVRGLRSLRDEIAEEMEAAAAGVEWEDELEEGTEEGTDDEDFD